jgi:hypothetical protein
MMHRGRKQAAEPQSSELSADEEALALQILPVTACAVSCESKSIPESNVSASENPDTDVDSVLFNARMELDRPRSVTTKDYYTHSATPSSVTIPTRRGSVVIPSKNRKMTTSASITVFRIDPADHDCRPVSQTKSPMDIKHLQHNGFVFGSPQTPRKVPTQSEDAEEKNQVRHKSPLIESQSGCIPPPPPDLPS